MAFLKIRSSGLETDMKISIEDILNEIKEKIQ